MSRTGFDPEQAEEYTQSLGQIIGGSWRQIAWADRNGIPDALGLSTRDWVEQRLGGYVRLQISDRREAVAQLAEEGMTQREIADVIGVDRSTVTRDLDDGAGAPAEPSDQDEQPQSGANARPKPSPAEERRKAKAEAARQVADGVGRAVHSLAALADANGAIAELVADYGPPALDIQVADLRRATTALGAITKEWRRVR